MTKTTPGAMRATPGPWEAIEFSCHARTTIVAKMGSKVMVIGECAGHGREAKESVADARLMAASPAMLEALQALMDEYKQRMDGDYPGENLHQFQSAYKMARAAISAATGEGKIG